MSKTLSYSFLLLKSSAEIRNRVLSKLKATERELVLNELEKTPYFSPSVLRSMKSAIVEESSQQALVFAQPLPKPIEQQKYSENLLAWILDSPVLSISDRDSAIQYLDDLDGMAFSILTEYVEHQNG